MCEFSKNFAIFTQKQQNAFGKMTKSVLFVLFLKSCFYSRPHKNDELTGNADDKYKPFTVIAYGKINACQQAPYQNGNKHKIKSFFAPNGIENDK